MSAFTYEVSHLLGIIVWLSYSLYDVVVPLILTPVSTIIIITRINLVCTYFDYFST